MVRAGDLRTTVNTVLKEEALACNYIQTVWSRSRVHSRVTVMSMRTH